MCEVDNEILPHLGWQQAFDKEGVDKMKKPPTELQGLMAALSVQWDQFWDTCDIIKALHKCHPIL